MSDFQPNGIAAPTAPLTLGSGPAIVGTITAVAAERKYNTMNVNQKFDRYIDGSAPTIAKGIDKGIELPKELSRKSIRHCTNLAPLL